jgi:hypothetical protein
MFLLNLNKQVEKIRMANKQENDMREKREEEVKGATRGRGQVALAIRNVYLRCLNTMHSKVCLYVCMVDVHIFLLLLLLFLFAKSSLHIGFYITIYFALHDCIFFYFHCSWYYI